jgi:hypothetical protein
MMTKTIHSMCGALAIILTVAFAGPSGEQMGATVSVAAQAPRAAALKGVIKSIDGSTAVIVPNDNKKVEVTFKVTSDTTRTGAVAAGDEVTVSYRFEKTERIATALTGKS